MSTYRPGCACSPHPGDRLATRLHRRYMETKKTLVVRVTGFEPAASCSQSRRDTTFATPGYSRLVCYSVKNLHEIIEFSVYFLCSVASCKSQLPKQLRQVVPKVEPCVCTTEVDAPKQKLKKSDHHTLLLGRLAGLPVLTRQSRTAP